MLVAEDMLDGVGVGRCAAVVGLEVVNGDGAAVNGLEGDLRAVALEAAGKGTGHAIDRFDNHAGCGRVGAEGNAVALDGFC